MEITILNQTKKELTFEVDGVGHTFCNLVKEMLHKNKSVEAASYSVDHPLVGKPRFIITTDGKEDPMSALKKAVKAVKSENTKMEKAISSIK